MCVTKGDRTIGLEIAGKAHLEHNHPGKAFDFWVTGPSAAQARAGFRAVDFLSSPVMECYGGVLGNIIG